jgi:short subunit dehydrogenase-like uncharacterized protein
MSAPWLLYGANGYTGELTLIEAVARGLKPEIAGRNGGAIQGLAERHGVTGHALDLGDQAKLDRILAGKRAVLHCAGPFSETAAPMIAACLRNRVHYFDITGEIEVFQHAHSRDADAQAAGIALVPGVGFDVVPTDCLALTLKHALPDATELTLAFEAGGGPSPGTAKSSIEGIAKGGRVRRGGQLVEVPLAFKTREIPFAHGRRLGVTIPWGDVFTSGISTGIPDCEVYLCLPPKAIERLKFARRWSVLLKLGFVQRPLKKRISASVRGPSEAKRRNSDAVIYGEVRNRQDVIKTLEMRTPNGYSLTVTASLAAIERALANEPKPGYHTASQLFGADFASGLPGVTVGELTVVSKGLGVL